MRAELSWPAVAIVAAVGGRYLELFVALNLTKSHEVKGYNAR
jgi:hypothetical protein